MKKDKLNYYDEFIRNVDFTLESARILNEYIENFDSNKSKEKENSVHKLENEADHNLHIVLNYLIKDFIPPFDREDIIMVAHAIDDLEDAIDEIVINIDIFGIKKLRPDVRKFTNLIYESCKSIREMFIIFKDKKKVKEMHGKIIEINEKEEAGDVLYQNAIKELFTNEQDAIEVIRWKNIYDCLEDCLDLAERIANCVEEIVMKLN